MPRFVLSLLALPLLALAAPFTAQTLPTCTSSNGQFNKTLRQTLINELYTVSQAGQEAGMASINILGYKGFGELIPGIVNPVTNNTNNYWIPSLREALIKCPTCRNSTTGKVMYENVKQYPVMPYEDLYDLFDITTNLINTISDKQCNIQGYYPPQSVRDAMKPFVHSLWSAMGVGPSVGAAEAGPDPSGIPSGAILPYYNCLAKHGTMNQTAHWQNGWFNLNGALYAINATNCVTNM